MIGGFCLYFVVPKLLPHLNGKKMPKYYLRLFFIGLTLTGVIFVTYTFFYCRSRDVRVMLYSVGIQASNSRSFVDSPICQGPQVIIGLADLPTCLRGDRDSQLYLAMSKTDFFICV